MGKAAFARALRAVAACFLVVALPSAVQASTPSRKSPHVEILGQARVETVPRRTVHKNHRAFLEFEITLLEVRLAADQPPHADRKLSIDTSGRVSVVHDLTCGGGDLTLAAGDRIEIQGEYVQIGKGKGLIHFTHSADAVGACDSGSKHPSGFLRKIPVQMPAAKTASAPPPAAAVPDQPYRGPLPPDTKPYLEIMRLRERGQSNEALLKMVQSEQVRYSLTTAEIQRLRASGVSTAVIEAMLASGRAVRATPTPR
jgi:hypothetical protein